VVTESKPSAALISAANAEGVQVRTLAQLAQETVQLDRYLRATVDQFDREFGADRYISVKTGLFDHPSDGPTDLVDSRSALNEWLRDPNYRFGLIVGSGGSGKT